MSDKITLLSALQIEQKITRLAYQILEDCFDADSIVLSGIVPSGSALAARLKQALQKCWEEKGKDQAQDQDIISINIQLDENRGLFFDQEKAVNLKNFTDKPILIVDDVLNTGRRMLDALGLFLQSTMPKIRTVVLVDRSHCLVPVSTDFVGIRLATTLQERVSVCLDQPGGVEDAVYLQ